jgi:hypothetical protein
METKNQSLTSEKPKPNPTTAKQNFVAKQPEASFQCPVAFQTSKLNAIWFISHCKLVLAREHTKCYQNNEWFDVKTSQILTCNQVKDFKG